MLKRILCVLTALLLLLPLICINSFAADSSKWTFIDGENITRQVNTAVIYRGIPNSGQTRWGMNLLLDESGTVTALYAGGNAEGENLQIPEGGSAISVSGIRLGWFEANVKVGSKLYYDGYTQRLFILDRNGNFDPYFSEKTTVSEVNGNYMLIDPTVDGTPPYTYDIAVDKNGTVIARGVGIEKPEGGFILSAATEDDRDYLIMYAPLGGKCSVTNGIATFTYGEMMLKNTIELVFGEAKAKAEEASTSFRDIDFDRLTSVIDTAEMRLNEQWDYKKAIEFIVNLERDIENVCAETHYGELRAAFHTPTEIESYDIYTTVKSAKDAGLNTLILRVSNGFNTIVPMEDGAQFSQNPIFKGLDVIEAYQNACAQEGIELALCFDVYYNESAATAAKDWVTAANGVELGLDNKYYSPASLDFKAYYLEYISYILSKYDGIKSIMFDYLRYPKFHENCDIGYEEIAMKRFSEQEDIPIEEVRKIKTELFQSPHWTKWNQFRTSLVSDMAKSISETVKELRPDVTMTVVAARDTVDYYYMQDALEWLDNELFDGLCLDFFNGDTDENDIISELAYADGVIAEKSVVYKAFTEKRAFFFTALESESKLTNELMGKMISETRESGAQGFVFSNLTQFIAQNYHLSLAENALKGESVSPLGTGKENLKKILEYSKSKINGTMLAAGAYEEKSANAACAKINDALVLIDENEFTKEKATELKQSIAVIFSASESKNTILREFDTIEIMVALAKEEIEQSGGDEETSTSDESKVTVENESDAVSQAGEESKALGNSFINLDLDINFAYVLIYIFVGLATVVAIVGMIVYFKRKNKRTPRQHMPKVSENGEDIEKSDEN